MFGVHRTDTVAAVHLSPASGSRIGVVVTDAYGPEDPDHDTPLLLTALRERGAEADALVWHDATTDWSAFDLLVLRSPWDYPERLVEFLAWLDRAEVAARVHNPSRLVRWNLDKHYLAELAEAGLAVVPTTYARTPEEARAALASADGRVVVKPARSAGARHTGLFDDMERALALADTILAEGNVAMVQPEVPELSSGGERALYLLDGVLTHAIAKGALLAPGGGFLGGRYQEHPVLVAPTEREVAFAEQTLAAVRAATGCDTPLYARIDLVDSADWGLVLLEVELAEQALNLHVARDVVDVAAEAILARVPR